jgi:peptidyl-dipeptidase A
MWAQNWEPIFSRLEVELLLPNASISGQEATRVLRNRYSSFSNLAEVAQDFFLSIGFQRLPPSFWTRSQFETPRDGRKTVCHGSATDFYSHEDVRYSHQSSIVFLVCH